MDSDVWVAAGCFFFAGARVGLFVIFHVFPNRRLVIIRDNWLSEEGGADLARVTVEFCGLRPPVIRSMRSLSSPKSQLLGMNSVREYPL